MNPETDQLNYSSETPQLSYNYDVDGRFFLPISNQIYQKVYNQYSYHPPTFLLIHQQPLYQPCSQTKKTKKKKVNNKEVEALKARIMEIEMREPELKIVKEVVTDTEQIARLEKELRMAKMQLEHEHENNSQKDRTISELRAQIQKNDLSRSSSLVSLQTALVERERQITKQDGIISQLQAEINLLKGELDDAHHHIEELQTTHEEVTVEKMTYLSKEVETWKQKFIVLNREYHETQEKLMLTEAELESIKKGEVKEVKQIVVEKKDNIGRTVDYKNNNQSNQIQQYKQKLLQMQQNYKIIDAPLLDFPQRCFQIIKELGQGGQGFVCLVKSINWGINDQTQYAMKSQQYTKQDEIEFINNLIKYQNQYEDKQSQNYNPSGIIRIYERFQWQNYDCIIMEQGEKDLYQFIQEQKYLPIQQKTKIFIQLSFSIKFLHKNNLIHRDIKPENYIKIGDQFKLIDFGLTRQTSGRYMTQKVGTPLFQAPEVVENRNDYTQSADIWSLGCVFYEILTSNPLFNGQNQQETENLIKSCKINDHYLTDKLNKLNIKEDIKTLLKNMLNPNHLGRIQIDQVIEKLKNMDQNQITMQFDSNLVYQNRQQNQSFQQCMDNQKKFCLNNQNNQTIQQNLNAQNNQQFNQSFDNQNILVYEKCKQIELNLNNLNQQVTQLSQEQIRENQFKILIKEQIIENQTFIQNQFPSKGQFDEILYYIKEQFAELKQQQLNSIQTQISQFEQKTQRDFAKINESQENIKNQNYQNQLFIEQIQNQLKKKDEQIQEYIIQVKDQEAIIQSQDQKIKDLEKYQREELKKFDKLQQQVLQSLKQMEALYQKINEFTFQINKYQDQVENEIQLRCQNQNSLQGEKSQNSIIRISQQNNQTLKNKNQLNPENIAKFYKSLNVNQIKQIKPSHDQSQKFKLNEQMIKQLQNSNNTIEINNTNKNFQSKKIKIQGKDFLVSQVP